MKLQTSLYRLKLNALWCISIELSPVGRFYFHSEFQNFSGPFSLKLCQLAEVGLLK